jgi:hypothetical protein
MTCGSAPFAIDSSNVYVVGTNLNMMGGTGLIAQALPPPGGPDAGPVDAGPDACGMLAACCGSGIPAASAQQCSQVVSFGHALQCDDALAKFEATGVCAGTRRLLASGVTCAASLTVSGSTLYYAIASQTSTGNGAGGATFYSVPTTGGKAMSSLGSVEGWSGGATAVSQGSIYFGPMCDNGPCGVVGVLPISGGSPTYTSRLSDDYGGQGELTSDSTGVYIATSGWNCGNGGGDGGVPAVLSGGTTVASIPPGGGPLSVLATTHDGNAVTSIAVDSSNVYWISGGNAWSAPKGGGTATPIAGNLGAPDAGATGPCGSVNGGTSSASPSLVSDGTYVYIADPSENAIYRVPVP